MLDSPNWLIGLVVTTVPSLMGMAIAPVVSVSSDRTRTRWGRRIPYLLGATPFVTLVLVLIGMSDSLGRWLQVHFFTHLTPVSATLWLVGFLVIAFQFLNAFITNIYIYLFNDVVPPELLSRFMALFRIVGIGASSTFQFFLFGMAETHMREIFVGSAILYGVIFTGMCLWVREGKYEPPLRREGGRFAVWSGIRAYAVECFSHRIYWYLFLANTFWAVNFAVVSFRVFFAQSVGLNLDEFGKLMGSAGLVSAVLLYPAAALADRWHPMRVMLLGLSLLLVVVPLQLVFLFVDVPPAQARVIYMVLFVLHISVQVLFNAAQLPLFMKLLPKDRFGQYFSAGGVITSAALMVAGVLSGAWLDWLQGRQTVPLYQYRYLPMWVSGSHALCLFFLVLLYRSWKRLGGDAAYQPPREKAAWINSDPHREDDSGGNQVHHVDR